MSEDLDPIRPDYESQTIRLADLVVTGTAINGKTFSNCHLVGPMMLMPLRDVTFAGCSFEAPADMLVVVIGDRPVFGAVAIVDSGFYDCRFTNVGFLGSSSFLDAFTEGLSAR